jgi:hypothetical protein
MDDDVEALSCAERDTLVALELELHRPQTRGNGERLAQLLHPAFREIGRSGRLYSREQALSELIALTQSQRIEAHGFNVDMIAPDLAMLTYQSEHLFDSGVAERHAMRSSIWQRTAEGWKIRFHQGTPCE